MNRLEKYNTHLECAVIQAPNDGPVAARLIAMAQGIAFGEAEEAAKTGAGERSKRWQWRLAWANSCSNALKKMKEAV